MHLYLDPNQKLSEQDHFLIYYYIVWDHFGPTPGGNLSALFLFSLPVGRLSFWERHSIHGNLHFLRQGMTRSPTPGCLVRAAIARFHLNNLIKGPALGIILRGQSLFLPQVGLNVFERNPLCLDGSGRFSCIKSAASYGVHGACSRGELGQDYVGRGATYLRDLERSEGWTSGPSPKLFLTRLMSALFV